MTNFADSLYEDLMAEHGAELAAAGTATSAAGSRRRFTRPAWAGVGTVAAGAAAAVGFTVFGGTAAAYAVTDNHNGTVTVSVTKAEGIAGANAKLKQLGAAVVVLQATPGCPPIDSFATPGKAGGQTTLGLKFGPGGDSQITVQAQGLPKNETMLVAFSFDGAKTHAAGALTDQPVPACVSLPAGPPKHAVTGTDGSGLKAPAAGSTVEQGAGSGAGLDQKNG